MTTNVYFLDNIVLPATNSGQCIDLEPFCYDENGQLRDMSTGEYSMEFVASGDEITITKSTVDGGIELGVPTINQVTIHIEEGDISPNKTDLLNWELRGSDLLDTCKFISARGLWRIDKWV